MDRGGYLAARSRHASVGDQGDALAPVLEHAERRHQLVQLGHAVGARPLESHDHHHVALELTSFERFEHLILIGKAARGGFDEPALFVDRASLEHRAPEIALHEAQASVALERVGCRTEHVDIGAFFRRLPHQLVAVQLRVVDPCVHRVRAGGHSIAVDQPFAHQRIGDERHPAGVVEVVHVIGAVGIDPRDQRDRRRELGEIAPVDSDPGSSRDRRQMDEMVGRAAGCEQPDHGVDDRFFIDDLGQRPLARLPQLSEAVNRGPRQRLPERRAGIDERGVGHVQAHQLHHHLVAVGGAIEGAGAGRMIGAAFGLQELVLAHFSFGVELPNPLLFLVGQARGHGSSGHQKHRQMAEAKCADQQARHDLVANAEQSRGIEHAVAERDRGAHRDHVAAEQRQVHAGLALSHPIAHRWNTAGDLRRRTDLARENLHLLGVAAIGLMSREHVVVSGYNSDVRTGERADRALVLARSGEAVREIAAA